MIQGLQTGGSMSRKPRVDRTPEEKWQIIQEGLKSGNISETCRRHGIAANLFYRWKDEAEQGAKAALGGKSAAAAETEKDRRIRQLERTLGRKSLEVVDAETALSSAASAYQDGAYDITPPLLTYKP
jgi:transposase-like protein